MRLLEQNGAWTAALFGGGLGLIERKPLIAGGLLGLLVYKPQLGILIPIALLAGRHWRAFAAATIVACTLIALSALIFGAEIWGEYVRNLAVLRTVSLEDGSNVWHRFVFRIRSGTATGGDDRRRLSHSGRRSRGGMHRCRVGLVARFATGRAKMPCLFLAHVSRHRIYRTTISFSARW